MDQLTLNAAAFASSGSSKISSTLRSLLSFLRRCLHRLYSNNPLAQSFVLCAQCFDFRLSVIERYLLFLDCLDEHRNQTAVVHSERRTCVGAFFEASDTTASTSWAIKPR